MNNRIKNATEVGRAYQRYVRELLRKNPDMDPSLRQNYIGEKMGVEFMIGNLNIKDCLESYAALYGVEIVEEVDVVSEIQSCLDLLQIHGINSRKLVSEKLTALKNALTGSAPIKEAK